VVLLSEIAHLQDLKTLAKSYIVALVESSCYVYRHNHRCYKSSVSFGKQFEVGRLEANKHSGTLVVAALRIANEVNNGFGEPQVLVPIYREFKLMLLSMPSYSILIGVALKRSANVDNNKTIDEIERLVGAVLKLSRTC
jgi:hypothetical protein